MIELDKDKYCKYITNLETIEINTLFALSVLKRQVEGTVFVDDPRHPNIFYIKNQYGMSLLYGETNNKEFYTELQSYLLNLHKEREKAEWLQVYPSSLNSKMGVFLKENRIKMKANEAFEYTPDIDEEKQVLEFERINFTFDTIKYSALKKNLHYKKDSVMRTTEEIFLCGEGSVIPKFFWNQYHEFQEQGGGFTYLIDGKVPASTAFTAYRIGEQLEIGIETMETYKGKGYATVVCSVLIDDCLDQGLEPVWSCSSGNSGSRMLALKLGFREVRRLPYYRLPI